MILQTPQDVLSFWFGSVDKNAMSTLDYIQEHMGIWFGGKSAEFDQVQKDNVSLLAQVSQQDLSEEWKSPEGFLARIILLDQFSRCIFRGTKEAFQYDEVSSQLVQEILNKGWFLTEYVAIQRFFFGVAIQHSENLEMQTIGVGLAESLALDANPDIQSFFANLKGYPHEHYEVIQKFGRFPSRNLAMGRETTPEELEWMNSPNCPAWARTQIPSRILRVGIISFGLSGRVFHCPFILTHPKFQLVAVYERSKNEAEEYLRQHNISTPIVTVRSLQELVDRDDLDVIVVCSPIEYHYEHARLSLLAGKHVLVEKAFCSTSSQAQELLDLAASRNLICMPYQNRRYDSDFRTIRQTVLNQLGDIVEYNGFYNRFSPAIRNIWKDTAPNSGGNFLSLGSHMIDQAVVLFGIPTSVWADIRVQRDGGILDDAWEVHLFYEKSSSSQSNEANQQNNETDYLHYGGFRAILKGSLICANHSVRYMIHGKNGSWMKNGVDPQEAVLMKGTLPDYRAANVVTSEQLEKYTESNGTLPYGCEEVHNWGLLTLANGTRSTTQSLPGSYHLLYDELYNCIVKKTSPSIDLNLSVVVLKIIEMARESSRTRTVIRWE